VNSAIRADNNESGAIWLENSAVREAAFGNFVDATAAATQGLKLAPASPGAMAEAALAFAMANDGAHAESLARVLNQRFPLDTQMQSLWLPAIHAQLELNQKKPRAAIDLLQAAIPVEFGQIPFVTNLSCLIPPTFAARPISRLDRATLPLSNFRRFSTTVASSGTAGRERWHIWAWLVPTLCKQELRRERMPMPPECVRSPPTKIS